MILLGPGGTPIICTVCGAPLEIPHACTNFPSPLPPRTVLADLGGSPSHEAVAESISCSAGAGFDETSDPSSAGAQRPPEREFRYADPQWGDVRPGARS